MARVYLDTQVRQAPVKQAQKTRVYLDTPQVQKPQKTRVYLDNKPTPKAKSPGLWNGIIRNLAKPISSATNLAEDSIKTALYPILNKVKPTEFGDYKKKLGIDFAGHQKDSWQGNTRRSPIDISAEFAGTQFKGDTLVSKAGREMALMTGVGGDLILDPLNKVKILGLTAKGLQATKTGKMALSAGEQATKGQRALLQIGKTNILPSVGNRVLAGASKTNDLIRGTGAGKVLANLGSKVSTGIRPADVSRKEFKILSEARTAAKNTENYTKDKAIQFAKNLEQTLRKNKATEIDRSQILHAIEKGDKTIAPKGLEQVFDEGMAFKAENESSWQALGGSTLEDYGMAHVATKEVAEASRKKSLQGGRIFSTQTPQDIRREWVKADGKVVNMSDSGITYSGKTGQYLKGKKPVNVTQATAKEINDFMKAEGKTPIFKEDLPTVVARMGISTGKKEAGVEYLRVTEGLTGTAKELAEETYQKITNHETVAKAIGIFDNIQNIWKAQVLVAPSYHIRNEAGNLWNNFLAGVSPTAYSKAGGLQRKIATGKLSKAESILVEDMKKNGVIGTGQYGGDITQTIADELGGAKWLGTLGGHKLPLPAVFSQNFGLYKGNRAVGSAIEDNAKIAHYLQKIGEGYGPKQAAESVKKYLFDYGDLTFTEQNLLKRVMPFYTWTRKNLPLQIQSFVNNPGKFSNAATLQRNIEGQVERPEEKYLGDYVKENSPMRLRTNSDGTTSYLMLGQWLPAASAFQFLSQAPKEIIRQITPIASVSQMALVPIDKILRNVSNDKLNVPKELIRNESFFSNSLGEQGKVEKYPGEMKSFLGVDMSGKMANVLKGIRVLNEIDKWNPGLIFGGKDIPSMVPGGSENRGAKHSPDAPESARFKDFIIGKASTYDPENSKKYYDADTEDRMGEYTRALDQAQKFKNPDRVKQIILEMEQFQQERDGKKSKVLDQYNLMGDQYLKDRYENKQAEFQRDDVRKKMREMIREGIKSGKNELIQEAIQLDPSYAKSAVSDALKETNTEQMSEKDKKLLYEIEQMKTEMRLQPFYTR